MNPHSVSIQTIRSTFASVDWFAPTLNANEDAIRVFSTQTQLMRTHSSELGTPRIEVVSGDWSDFHRLAQQVRVGASFEWRYGYLKKVALNFLRQHNWPATYVIDSPRAPARSFPQSCQLPMSHENVAPVPAKPAHR